MAGGKWQPGKIPKGATPFKPGQSGNPKGTPKRKMTARQFDQMYDATKDVALQHFKRMVDEGQKHAVNFVMERAQPAVKAGTSKVAIQGLNDLDAEDYQGRCDLVLKVLADGLITQDQANGIIDVISKAAGIRHLKKYGGEHQVVVTVLDPLTPKSDDG